MTGLTSRQASMLRWIMDEVVRAGRPPTIRETMAKFDLSNLGAVTAHWDALERKDYIRREPGKASGIQVLKDASGRAVRLGYLTAGRHRVDGYGVDMVDAVDESGLGLF